MASRYTADQGEMRRIYLKGGSSLPFLVELVPFLTHIDDITDGFLSMQILLMSFGNWVKRVNSLF